MHKQVIDFLEEMKVLFPDSFKGNILECGSLNVNGSANYLFEPVEYIGIDCNAGKGVDYVSLVHEFSARQDGYFNTVISTEMLEHDPFWKKSIKRMVEFIKPGGTLIITYAGSKRPKHEVWASPRQGYYFSPGVVDVYNRVVEGAVFKYTLIRIMDDPSDVQMFLTGKMK